MLSYDLYGSTCREIDLVKEELEQSLHCRFDARESEYLGDYYRCDMDDGESIVIRRNWDPIDEEISDHDFPGENVLIDVNDSSRGEELKRLLTREGSTLYLLREEKL